MSQYNELSTPIDRVSKLLFREYAEVLVKLTFPDQDVRLVSVEENVEINLPTRPVDTVMIVATEERGEERHLALHVEYYARYRPDVPRTLFIYSAELTDRMNMPVVTVVIYSERRERERRPRPEYAVLMGDRVMNRFTFADIWLVDLTEEIRSGQLAPLAPFLLEIVPDPSVETAQEARRLALTEPDPERRGLLLSFVALLAGRYLDRDVVREMFRKEIDMIQTNTFFDDWLEEAEKRGVQKGREEGREQGREKEAQEMLLRLLAHRFPSVPVKLVLRIQKLNADALSDLFDLALTASSLDEIEQAVNQQVAGS